MLVFYKITWFSKWCRKCFNQRQFFKNDIKMQVTQVMLIFYDKENVLKYNKCCLILAKRKSQQQTRQAYKWLKRMEDEEEKHGTVKDLLNGDGECYVTTTKAIHPSWLTVGILESLDVITTFTGSLKRSTKYRTNIKLFYSLRSSFIHQRLKGL